MGLLTERSGSARSKGTIARKAPRLLRKRMSWGAVEWSPDLSRVIALPRRPIPNLADVVREMTAKLKHPLGTQTLREYQAWTLWEAPQVGGIFAQLAVGSGKTLCGLLMPMVMPCPPRPEGKENEPLRAVLFIPPSLKAQLLEHDWEFYGRHWKLPNLAGSTKFEEGLPTLHVVAYSDLSNMKSTLLLERIKPDLIIADECFPAGTRISTKIGPKTIETIQVGDTVSAFNPTTGCFEWRCVIRVLRKYSRELVRVIHQHGELVCTPSHKIWSEERGYVRADSIGGLTVRVLEESEKMRVVRGSVLPEMEDESKTKSTFLRAVVCGELEDVSAVARDAVEEHAARIKRVASWSEGPGCSRTDEEQKPDGRPISGAEDVDGSLRAGKIENILVTWREWAADEATDGAREPDVTPDGVRNPNEASSWPIPESPRLLQGGPGGPRTEASDRSGRRDTQEQEVEVLGPEEGSRSFCSRVDRVEVLERGGLVGHREGGDDDLVYDLEVEGLHNYVADGVVVSNCHLLKNYGASKTKRFLSFLANYPDTRFCGWSGTVTSRGLRDYAHLAAIALGEGSPLPLETKVVEEWALALDPNDSAFDEGMLSALCVPGEAARNGFRRRLVDTQGVVATAEDALGTSLTFHRREAPKLPENIFKFLRDLRRPPNAGGWKRPDGEELVNAMQVNTCARELACGFYYRWKFPRQEPLELRKAWFARRQEWNRELREKLKNSSPHLDSPALCENAAKRWYAGGCTGCERKAKEPHGSDCREYASHPLWDSYTYPAWSAVEDTIEHEQETVWESDFLLKDAASWMKDGTGIVWVEHAAVGHALAKLSGAPYYGGGKAADAAIIKETGKRSIICGESHATGKNLQEQFHRALVLSPSPDAQLLEQTIGRIHRPGQPEDEVEIFFYLHTAELKDALEKARMRAQYVHETWRSSQKLAYGAWAFT